MCVILVQDSCYSFMYNSNFSICSAQASTRTELLVVHESVAEVWGSKQGMRNQNHGLLPSTFLGWEEGLSPHKSACFHRMNSLLCHRLGILLIFLILPWAPKAAD